MVQSTYDENTNMGRKELAWAIVNQIHKCVINMDKMDSRDVKVDFITLKYHYGPRGVN